MELKKNFAFYPLGDDSNELHDAKKRRDRKKRLSTFGLDGLDEMIGETQAKMARLERLDSDEVSTCGEERQ